MDVRETRSTIVDEEVQRPIGMSGQLVPFDPRSHLDEGALIEASRLAYPAVATPPSRKEGVALAVGGGAPRKHPQDEVTLGPASAEPQHRYAKEVQALWDVIDR